MLCRTSVCAVVIHNFHVIVNVITNFITNFLFCLGGQNPFYRGPFEVDIVLLVRMLEREDIHIAVMK